MQPVTILIILLLLIALPACQPPAGSPIIEDDKPVATDPIPSPQVEISKP